MSEWAVIIPADRWATERLFHHDTVTVPAAAGAVQPDDEVLLVADGGVVALKGLGGFHLACVASDEGAVATLRARKHREDKPFALMVRDVRCARLLARLGRAEEALLCSRARPIVLAPRRADAAVARAWAGLTAAGTTDPLAGLTAATAVVHGLTVLTVEPGRYAGTGAPVLDASPGRR